MKVKCIVDLGENGDFTFSKAYKVIREDRWMDYIVYNDRGKESFLEGHECEVIEEEPTEWSGEGLPPVGTVCEVRHAEGWRGCEIIAHFENRVATVAAYTITLGDNGKILDCAIERCFRPIKSEKDKEIESIKNALDYHSITYMGLNQELAEHLYNAGFRLTKDSK